MEVAHGERWDPRANMASGANLVDYTYTHKNMTTTTTYTLRHAYEQDRESNNYHSAAAVDRAGPSDLPP